MKIEVQNKVFQPEIGDVLYGGQYVAGYFNKEAVFKEAKIIGLSNL